MTRGRRLVAALMAAVLALGAGCTAGGSAPTPARPRRLPVSVEPAGPRPDTIVLAIGTTGASEPMGASVRIVAVSIDGTSSRDLVVTNGAMAIGGLGSWARLSPGADKLAYIEHLYKRNRQRVFVEDLATGQKTSRFYGLPGPLLWDGDDVVFQAAPPPYRGISQTSNPRELQLTRIAPSGESSVTTYTVPPGTRDPGGAMSPIGSDETGIYFAEVDTPPFGPSALAGIWRASRADRSLELLGGPVEEMASPTWAYGGVGMPPDPTRTHTVASVFRPEGDFRTPSPRLDHLPWTVTLYRFPQMSLIATYAVPAVGPASDSVAGPVRFGYPVLAPDGLSYLQLRPAPQALESTLCEVDAASSKVATLAVSPPRGRIDQFAYADEFRDVVYTTFSPGDEGGVVTVRLLDRSTGRDADLARLVSTSEVQHQLLGIIGTYSSNRAE